MAGIWTLVVGVIVNWPLPVPDAALKNLTGWAPAVTGTGYVTPLVGVVQGPAAHAEATVTIEEASDGSVLGFAPPVENSVAPTVRFQPLEVSRVSATLVGVP